MNAWWEVTIVPEVTLQLVPTLMEVLHVHATKDTPETEPLATVRSYKIQYRKPGSYLLLLINVFTKKKTAQFTLNQTKLVERCRVCNAISIFHF